MALRNIAQGRKSGYYTPTLTGVANVAAATCSAGLLFNCNGDMVTVSGVINVDPTAATTTTLGISLPFPYDVVAGKLSGVAVGAASGVVAVTADATNDRAQISYTAASTAAEDVNVLFQYSTR